MEAREGFTFCFEDERLEYLEMLMGKHIVAEGGKESTGDRRDY